jgi:uncharacterized protein YdeI (YjbR/CyaY-like superfamily)
LWKLLRRKVWNSRDERQRRVIWRCNKKYVVRGERGCENKDIDDRVLCKAFISVFNAMVENKNYFLEKWNEGLKSESVLVRYKCRAFIKIIGGADLIEEFDMDIYFKIIEK